MNEYKIKSLIDYFRHSKWQYTGNESKMFPSSNTVVLNQVIVSRLGNILKAVPKDVIPQNKQSRNLAGSDSFDITVYPKRRLESMFISNDLERGQIALAVFDPENTMNDIRLKGGGVTRSYIKNMYGINKQLYSYTDLGRYDGYPTSLGNTIIFELPLSILTTYSLSNIEQMIHKYIAFGKHPIILFY